jgi:hypothetical protein
MACMTMFAPTMAMATTQLTRAIGYEETWRMEVNSERSSLRMNWVVVTDENGNRKLTMQWAPGGVRPPLRPVADPL